MSKTAANQPNIPDGQEGKAVQISLRIDPKIINNIEIPASDEYSQEKEVRFIECEVLVIASEVLLFSKYFKDPAQSFHGPFLVGLNIPAAPVVEAFAAFYPYLTPGHHVLEVLCRDTTVVQLRNQVTLGCGSGRQPAYILLFDQASHAHPWAEHGLACSVNIFSRHYALFYHRKGFVKNRMLESIHQEPWNRALDKNDVLAVTFKCCCHIFNNFVFCLFNSELLRQTEKSQPVENNVHR